MQRSEQKGFGTIVSVLPGRVIVLQTMEGTPSAKAGLSAGDEILAINNIPLSRLEFEQLIQLLTEARQQEAVLDVRKPGNARLLRITLVAGIGRCAQRGPRVHDRARASAICASHSFEEPTGKLVKETIEKLGGAY